jgi:mannose-1-phosphate guanylyltransferase
LKAVLLAAGLGTRLRPVTYSIPKCLVPIHGKPLLAYWLDLLLKSGIAEVLTNTHHLAEQVVAFRQASSWRDRLTLVHEPELLGTGGTVIANRDFFGRNPVVVAHADNLSRFPVRDFLDAHERRPSRTVMTMMTFDTDAPHTCGIVELDAQGVVSRFHEKVANFPGTRANGAVYIIEPELVDFMVTLGKPVVDLSTEVIPYLIGRIATYHNRDYHRDIGSLEGLRCAEAEYREAVRR